MNINQCVESLSMPLPEDILKRKWAGDLEGAVKAIDRQLQEELPDMLRAVDDGDAKKKKKKRRKGRGKKRRKGTRPAEGARKRPAEERNAE